MCEAKQGCYDRGELLLYNFKVASVILCAGSYFKGFDSMIKVCLWPWDENMTNLLKIVKMILRSKEFYHFNPAGAGSIEKDPNQNKY